MTPFASLGLWEPLLRAVDDLGYEMPTPIQVAAVPAILAARDVLGAAKTGSGKTVAFVLPILQNLSPSAGSATGARHQRADGRVRVLMLVPTRELAAQIAEVIAACGRHLPAKVKSCVAVGGVSINPQMMALRGGADILVGTPGRILDLVDQNALHLDAVDTLVLDEADRLLSLGFAEELGRVLELLPPRQTLLFSATFPPGVHALANQLLDDPVRIDIEEGAKRGHIDASIVQRAIAVDAPRRTMLLRHLLSEHAWSHVLVFVASRYTAGHVVDKLQRAKISAAALHGDISQGARTQALADFKAQRIQVLVATDVAARGIDIAELPAVVNYDLPRSPVDYVHRIGRTGRAGQTGTAISFITADAEPHFRLIEKRHEFRIEREHVPGFEPTMPVAEPTGDAPTGEGAADVGAGRSRPVLDPFGGVKGKRKSKKDKLREAAKRAK